MRTAAFPTFRKLYRRLRREDSFADGLPAGNYSLSISYSILLGHAPFSEQRQNLATGCRIPLVCDVLQADMWDTGKQRVCFIGMSIGGNHCPFQWGSGVHNSGTERSGGNVQVFITLLYFGTLPRKRDPKKC